MTLYPTLSNAVQFTDNGEVALSVSSSADVNGEASLNFTVRDIGIGLSPEGMSRLCQSFSQADSSTTRKYGGAGLGPAVSKRMADLMGGTMWAKSEGLGKGPSFYFTIQSIPTTLPETKARILSREQSDLLGKTPMIRPPLS